MQVDNLPLLPGVFIPHYGKIIAVGFTGGERYYWLSKGNGVAMIPASIIESLAVKK